MNREYATPGLTFALTGRVWNLPSGRRMLTVSLVHPAGRIETLHEGEIPGSLNVTDDPGDILRDALKLPKVETKPWHLHG